MSEAVIAYCVKCRQKQAMQDARPVFTRAGRAATQGTCPACGTKLFLPGHTPAHAGLDPREHIKAALAGSPKLVIVESPAKARTVGRFLGQAYLVKASVGHVRDLPANRMGIDVENDFAPRYVIPQKKKDVVRELKAGARQASEIYLATDPDREGEAIAWHLLQVLGREAQYRPVQRVEFHEITQEAIAYAFAHPRQIDLQRVEAQQARRILDRLVGYTISPLLREKMGRKGLSAGRVQSVAVRLVVEREREIAAFAPVEYWSIEAELVKAGLASAADVGAGLAPALGTPSDPFKAKLWRIDDREVALKSHDGALAIVAELEQAAYSVLDVKRRERRRNPAAPFTTSTLQQEASRRLGFTAKRTMAVAQGLYEGVDLGGGERVGLITYMRSDSTNVAETAQREARDLIGQKFGPAYLPQHPPVYKTRAKAAQEAHEAIRPTSVMRQPAAAKPYLERDPYRLYELVWKRFVASQMAPAVLDLTSVEVEAKPNIEYQTSNLKYIFRASGSLVRFPGFLAVYEEARDEGEAPDEGEAGQGVRLPPLEPGQALDLVRLLPEQHFTQPPSRFTEASLVRALEAHGIGRPSTYAPTLSTIQQRYYVERQAKQLVPTELGYIVNDLLVKHFPDIADLGFTAQMEDDLDRVASGELARLSLLRQFYGPFSQTLAAARETMEELRLAAEPTGEACPQCGNPLLIKLGRHGRFIGCSTYPACRYRASILVKTGLRCPECGNDIVERRTRRKRTFFGCAGFREGDETSCRFSTWKRPLSQPCPACGGLLLEAGLGLAQCYKCEKQVALDNIGE
ncbi:MAG: type I DNA topoisomerase [Thermoflexales bacterium]|nr:type I DNA topoisomerase [Thermoflexales bacterium]